MRARDWGAGDVSARKETHRSGNARGREELRRGRRRRKKHKRTWPSPRIGLSTSETSGRPAFSLLTRDTFGRQTVKCNQCCAVSSVETFYTFLLVCFINWSSVYLIYIGFNNCIYTLLCCLKCNLIFQVYLLGLLVFQFDS